MPSLFKREKSLGELDEELDRIKVEDEITTRKAEIAEKEAVIKQLKREYGPGWRKMLNIKSWMDVATLRSFLKGANQGMKKEAGRQQVGGGIRNSPLFSLTEKGFGGIHKA